MSFTSFATWKALGKTYDNQFEAFRKTPSVSRAVEQFKGDVKDTFSLDEFINNPRTFNFAMRAFGLGEITYAKGLMKKVLNSDLSDRQSLANTLVDRRYREMAGEFRFQEFDAAKLQWPDFIDSVVARYERVAFEESYQTVDPQVETALKFSRRVPQFSSWYEILAEKDLAEVVRTTLGFSDQFALVSIDKQVAKFSERMDIAEFKDPKKMDKFLQRYFILSAAKNSASQLGSTPPGIVPLSSIGPYKGPAGIVSIDPSLVLSAMALRGRY